MLVSKSIRILLTKAKHEASDVGRFCTGLVSRLSSDLPFSNMANKILTYSGYCTQVAALAAHDPRRTLHCEDLSSSPRVNDDICDLNHWEPRKESRPR